MVKVVVLYLFWLVMVILGILVALNIRKIYISFSKKIKQSQHKRINEKFYKEEK